MRATVKGMILEKVMKNDKDGNPVQPVLRLYQGDRDNLDVKVSPETYNKAQQGKVVEMECQLNPYHFNGSTGISAKEAKEKF